VHVRGELIGIVRQVVGSQLCGCQLDDLGKLHHLPKQRQFCGVGEQSQVGIAGIKLFCVPEDGANARMCVLNIVDGILVRLRYGEIQVKLHLAVC